MVLYSSAWLPETAIFDGKLLHFSKGVVDDLITLFLGRGYEINATLVCVNTAVCEVREDFRIWDSQCGKFSFSISERLVDYLSKSVISDGTQVRPSRPVEFRFLEVLADKTSTCFAQRIASEFEVEVVKTDQARNPSGQWYAIMFNSINGETLAEIFLTREKAVNLRKGLVEGQNLSMNALSAISTALHDYMLRVQMHLGGNELSIGDIAGLEAGDTIVLDRPISDQFQISVNGHVIQGSKAVFAKDNGAELQLVAPA